MSEASLDTISEKLIELARQLADEQWRWHLAFNENRRPSDKSKLNLYVRARKRSMELYWSRFQFVRRPGREKAATHRYYISKGKGDKYPDPRLTQYAQEDEVEALLEFEARAAEIRKAFRLVREARERLNKFRKLDISKEVEDE